MLLSRSPLASARGRVPFDLHVLGAPPAFILSQDRTLRPNMMAGRAVRSRSWFGGVSPSRPACLLVRIPFDAQRVNWFKEVETGTEPVWARTLHILKSTSL